MIRFLAFWLCASACFAVDIVAPQTANPCSLIRATSTTPAKSYLWFISTSNNDIVDFEQFNENKSVVFTGPPGKYLVRCVILTEDGKLEQAHHIITVTGNVPVPPPGPTPPGPGPGPEPGPSPLEDCSKAGSPVAVDVCKAARNLPPAAKNNIAAVAAAYDTVIQKASAAEPGYVTVNELQAKLKAERDAVMGDPASWATWSEAVSPLWSKLWADNGNKPSRVQILEFHSQVSRGLKHSIGK